MHSLTVSYCKWVHIIPRVLPKCVNTQTCSDTWRWRTHTLPHTDLSLCSASALPGCLSCAHLHTVTVRRLQAQKRESRCTPACAHTKHTGPLTGPLCVPTEARGPLPLNPELAPFPPQLGRLPRRGGAVAPPVNPCLWLYHGRCADIQSLAPG